MTHDQRRQRRAAMAAAVAGGRTAHVVARRFGVSLTLVWRACREAGVALSPVRTRAPQLMVVGALFDTTRPMSAIADQYGVSKQWVYRVRRMAVAAGIPLPRRDKS